MIPSIYIYPTDTVWGIGASIESRTATREIAMIKQTSFDKPLSVLFSSLKQLREYIEIPNDIDNSWLEVFFSLESTLAVPRQWANSSIPDWVLADSDLVALRCLSLTAVSTIISEVKAPITTTSFNLSGTPSIKNRDQAYRLYSEIAPQHQFIDDLNAPLSGNSSSIVKLLDDVSFSFIRKGSCWEKIEKHVQLLST